MSSSYGPLVGKTLALPAHPARSYCTGQVASVKTLKHRVLIKFLSVSMTQWLIFFIGVNCD
jgi:hypothetical protein